MSLTGRLLPDAVSLGRHSIATAQRCPRKHLSTSRASISSPRPRRRVPRQQRPGVKHTGLVSSRFRQLWKEDETYPQWTARRAIQYAWIPGLPDEIANNPTGRFDLVQESHPLPVTVRFSPNRIPRLFDKATREINHVLGRHQKTRQGRRRQDRGFALVFEQRNIGTGRKIASLNALTVESSAPYGSARTAFRLIRPLGREGPEKGVLRPNVRQDHPVEPLAIESRYEITASFLPADTSCSPVRCWNSGIGVFLYQYIA